MPNEIEVKRVLRQREGNDMAFEQIINQVTNPANSDKHILIDGRFTCSYQEIHKPRVLSH